MLPIRSTVNYSLSLDGMPYNKLGHFNNTKIIFYSFTRTNKDKDVYFVLKLYLVFCAWFGFDVYKNKKVQKINAQNESSEINILSGKWFYHNETHV